MIGSSVRASRCWTMWNIGLGGLYCNNTIQYNTNLLTYNTLGIYVEGINNEQYYLTDTVITCLASNITRGRQRGRTIVCQRHQARRPVQHSDGSMVDPAAAKAWVRREQKRDIINQRLEKQCLLHERWVQYNVVQYLGQWWEIWREKKMVWSLSLSEN